MNNKNLSRELPSDALQLKDTVCKRIQAGDSLSTIFEDMFNSDSRASSQFNLELLGRVYGEYLKEHQEIDIEYFFNNLDNFFILRGIKETIADTQLVHPLSVRLIDYILQDQTRMCARYPRSKMNFSFQEKYSTALNVWTSNYSYLNYLQGDALEFLNLLVTSNLPSYLELIEKIHSPGIIQEFIFRKLFSDQSNKPLLFEMIQIAPNAVGQSAPLLWNGNISILIIIGYAFEELKELLSHSQENDAIEFVSKLCTALKPRIDKDLIIYSFSAYLIRLQLFPWGKVQPHRRIASDAANKLIDGFKTIITKFDFNQISLAVNGAESSYNNELVRNFKETGKLLNNFHNSSSYYPLLVMIALFTPDENSVDECDAWIRIFESTLPFADEKFYYSMPNNDGASLLCNYHFYIASAYVYNQFPAKRWIETHDFLTPLFSRFFFDLHRKDFSRNLSAISFFLHIGIALVDILSTEEEFDKKENIIKICDLIWDDYKNIVISSGEPFSFKLNTAITYFFVFLCINNKTKNDFSWLHHKLCDFHAFPALQIDILINLRENISKDHPILKDKNINTEFQTAWDSLKEYVSIVDFKNRNGNDFHDKNIAIYNAFLQHSK